MRLPFIALLALLPVVANAADPWGKVDLTNAKALHDKACTSCHVSKYGGDGSKIYTRDGRKTSSKQELLQRVATCNAMINSGFFPEEEGAVAAHEVAARLEEVRHVERAPHAVPSRGAHRVPTDRIEHAGARLADRFEVRRGRGAVQHFEREFVSGGEPAQLLFRRVTQRIVESAHVVPGLRLRGVEPELHGPAIEEARDARDVRAALLADLRPVGHVEGTFGHRALVMRRVSSVSSFTTCLSTVVASSISRNAEA